MEHLSVERTSTVYFAKKILSGSEVIDHGAIRVENGVITDIGPKTGIRRQGDAILNLGDLILVPGFINLHTNLEEASLRGLVDEEISTPFESRLRCDEILRTNDESESSAQLRASLTANECIANGITTVVTPQKRFGRSFFDKLPIHVRTISDSSEITGSTQFSFARKVSEQVSLSQSDGFFTPYLFSHHPAYLKEVQRILQRNRYHYQMTLGESSDEVAAFHEQRGIIYDYVTKDSPWFFSTDLQSPAKAAITRNLIPRHSTIINPNYSGTDELLAFQSLSSTVAITPRYSQLFDLRRFPVGVAQENRLNIAVCTGTPALHTMNLLDELFEIRMKHTNIPADQLLAMITINPAKALRLHNELGSLEVGKRAHIVGIRSNSFSSNPLEDLIQGEVSIEFVCIDGEELIVP